LSHRCRSVLAFFFTDSAFGRMVVFESISGKLPLGDTKLLT
jgi:hypothetical protein